MIVTSDAFILAFLEQAFILNYFEAKYLFQWASSAPLSTSHSHMDSEVRTALCAQICTYAHLSRQ